MTARIRRAAARATAPLEQLLGRIPSLALVVGKGGVGKTTCAVGISAALAARGHRTLLVSTDPAGTAGAALGVVLSGGTDVPVPGHAGLFARQISANEARRAFLERWRETLVEIVDRGTYLDHADVEGLIDAALPGADEVFALLALARLSADREQGGYDRLVVDTAPTGHTVRLLHLPSTFAALVALLDAMQEKHRFMVRALTHRYRPDVADAFLADMRASVDGFRAALADRARTAAVLVTRPERVVEAETARYAAALGELGIAVDVVVINAVRSEPGVGEIAAHIVERTPGALHAVLPLLPEHPVGVDEIQAAMDHLVLWGAARERGEMMRAVAPGLERDEGAAPSLCSGGAPRGPPAGALHTPAAVNQPSFVPSLLRAVTFTGGKGGVGKTTVSCALAIAAAARGRARHRVLLVSTDPAPSIADALGQAIGDRETEVAGVPGLLARQMDAEAAFRELRDRYRSRIDDIFDRFVAHGLDAAYDRAILRDLLALAPPGIDELYALASLGDVLASERFDHIVVDPAPTGHLLRLLEMPTLALDWSHRLMRLLLKYRELAGSGELAEDLLGFARRTRELEQLLHDPSRAGLIVVALDEPLVRGETARLVDVLRERSIAVLGVLWNRVVDAREHCPEPLPAAPSILQLVAPAAGMPLVGVDALRAWLGDWRALGVTSGVGALLEPRDDR